MAGRGRQRKAAPADGLTASEAQVQQQVLRHYAKTVYFNDLWKSFLSKMAGLVLLMAAVQLQRMHLSERGLGFIAGFEVLSLLIATSTVLFVQRWWNPLMAFKVSFAFSLLQAFWFGHSYYRRKTGQDREIGDLAPDQLAFGVMYFVFCWMSDRFMMRSQDQAKTTADEMQEVLRKTN
jgi:hypothetical protein